MNYPKKYSKRPKQNLPVEYGDYQPPQANDVEEAVLAAVIINAKFIDKLMGTFTPSIFFNINNRLICYAILELYHENKPIEVFSIIHKLKEKGTLETVGGPVYLAEITSKISSTANVEYHIRILQQEALKRKIIESCSNSVRKAFDTSEDIFDVFQALQQQLDSSLKEIVKYDVQLIGEVHEKILRESIELTKTGHRSGVITGLRMVDNVTNGWQKSDFIIIAGRPSMGKTAAAVSMILTPAIDEKKAIAIFSLEMSREQLVARMQSNLSGINVSKIIKKQLNLQEIDIIAQSCIELEKTKIFIDDTPSITLLELKGKARKLVKENNVELIVIDYLQLMRSGLNIMQREQEIAEISRGLKGLAKELDIPIIALSQLSRGVEMRNDKKPMLSDLRESGQIEQDADMVMFCYRPDYYGIENYQLDGEDFDSKGLFLLIIAKHRNGELGEIPLLFIGHQTKLTNYNFDNNPFTPIEPNNQTITEPKTTKTLYEIGLQINKTDGFEDIPF
jgi:replicative DNA helicase